MTFVRCTGLPLRQVKMLSTTNVPFQ